MKKTLLIIFTIIFSSNIQAQYTERFESFANKIEPIDSIKVNKTYKKNLPKEIGGNLIYEHNSMYYKFGYGKWFEYYDNGKIKTETLFDNFGITLYWKFYSKNGELRFESKTLNIDTSADNLEKFLHKNKYVEQLSLSKKYKYSNKSKKNYLFMEGKVLNEKQIGVWKKYNENGEIIKEIMK